MWGFLAAEIKNLHGKEPSVEGSQNLDTIGAAKWTNNPKHSVKLFIKWSKENKVCV